MGFKRPKTLRRIIPESFTKALMVATPIPPPPPPDEMVDEAVKRLVRKAMIQVRTRVQTTTGVRHSFNEIVVQLLDVYQTRLLELEKKVRNLEAANRLVVPEVDFGPSRPIVRNGEWYR